MPHPSPLPAATVVARLSTDGTRARQIGDLLAESFDAEEVAASAFEQPDGRWSLALHFRRHPDETAVRALIASTAGKAAADALVFETLSPTDWVRKSLEGLTPVEAGRFVVHGAHHRASVRANQIGIQIEAALAFGTGHHGTTRGCLLALDALVKARRRERKARGSPALRQRRGRKPACSTSVPAQGCSRSPRQERCVGRCSQATSIPARSPSPARTRGSTVSGLLSRSSTRRVSVPRVSLPCALRPGLRQHPPGAPHPTGNTDLAPPGTQRNVPRALRTADGAGGPSACKLRARGLVLVRRIRLEGWATLVLSRPRR